jgi:cytochrome b
MSAADNTPKIRVWDLPTRLFHWALTMLVIVSVVTAKIGGNVMDYHLLSGYTILALLVFRILWGVAGDRYALFSSFVRSPGAIFSYARGMFGGAATNHAGHNPLGALSVLALLLVLLLQATTGLFANDEIFTEGPLAKLVSGSTSLALTSVHRVNQYAIYALVALHLLAIAYYWFGKRDNLVTPMITGDKQHTGAESASDNTFIRVRAAVLAAVAAGLVTYVVRL